MSEAAAIPAAPPAEAPKKAAPVRTATAASSRPSRARKEVQRFVVPTTDKAAEKEEYKAEGKGTAIGDLPNVDYRMSRIISSDPIFPIIHRLLFGTPGKKTSTKADIRKFNGFVWTDTVTRAKKEESLQRLTKAATSQIIEIFEIDAKKSAPKEEQIKDILNFFEKPKSSGKNHPGEAAKALADKKKRQRENKAKKRARSRDKREKEKRKKEKAKAKREKERAAKERKEKKKKKEKKQVVVSDSDSSDSSSSSSSAAPPSPKKAKKDDKPKPAPPSPKKDKKPSSSGSSSSESESESESSS